MARKANLTMVMLAVCGVLALSGPAWSADGNDPISHWTFDEGSGSIAFDWLGDNDGILYGPNWTDGMIDGGLAFDGVDDYIDVGNDNSLKSPLPITLAAWISLSNLGKTQWIIGLDEQDGTTYYGVWFYVSAKNKLVINYGDGEGNDPSDRRSKIGTSGLDSDTWYHVAVVLRGPTDISFYIDGADEEGMYCGSGGALMYSTGSMFIGMRNPYGSCLEGKMDDVRVYNRALSAQEIQDLYPGHLAVAVDIKLGSCRNPLNVKSKGVLPVAILGTEDFDVNSIDVVSVRLAGVGAVRSAYGDVAGPVSDGNECECSEEGPDGYIDLTVKFRTAEVVEELVKTHGDLIDGEVLALPLTGVLSDGSPIEGADCVRIIGKVPRPLAAKRSDINEDGVVNILDFAMMAEYWLESAETCY